MIDAHTIETLRLRTAALHRIGRTNDALRARLADAERERDELRAERGDWQASARLEVFDRLGQLRLERDEAVAALVDLRAKVEALGVAWEKAAQSPAAPAFVRLALRDLRAVLDGGR